MTKPKTDYEMKRDEASITNCANLDSIAPAGECQECFTFKIGSDFGAAYERERAENLAEVLEHALVIGCFNSEGSTEKWAREALAEYKGEV